MLGSDILEVVIGLVFTYLLMSLVATAAREVLEGFLKKRGRYLEQGLIELFGHAAYGTNDDRNLLERFYNHPLIFSLFRGDYLPPEQRTEAAVAARAAVSPAGSTETPKGGLLPSYIPSGNFADAVLGVAESYLRPGLGGQPLSFDRLTAAAWAVPNPPVRRVLLQALASAKGDLDQTRAFLESWYDGAMDRVSGLYRRRTQTIVFLSGLAMCVALNVNTVVIGHALHENAAMREAVGEAARQWVDRHPLDGPCGSVPQASPACPAHASASLAEQFREPRALLHALSLPIGWSKPLQQEMLAMMQGGALDKLAGALELAVGWLVTALAVTLGAPFWFDVLNTVMVVRSTVKPTEKSPDEPSKDGRRTASRPLAMAAAHPVVAGQGPVPPTSDDVAGAREIAALDPAARPREDDPDAVGAAP